MIKIVLIYEEEYEFFNYAISYDAMLNDAKLLLCIFNLENKHLAKKIRNGDFFVQEETFGHFEVVNFN